MIASKHHVYSKRAGLGFENSQKPHITTTPSQISGMGFMH